MEVTADKARSPCPCENASTEPNAPQPPHLPNHLAVWKPHWRQTCCTAALEEPMRAPYEGGLTRSENATPQGRYAACMPGGAGTECSIRQSATLDGMRAAVIG